MDVLPAPPLSHPLLVRPNSISTSNMSDDVELLSIKSASHYYSSLRDLLPSVAVNSPKLKSGLTRPDIHIRNRLVKQAAWSYLQPMSSTSPDYSGVNFFQRLWVQIAAFIDLFCTNVIRVLDGTLRIRNSILQRSEMSFV